MIKYDTSKDLVAKIILKWCKDNDFIYSFETKDKSRNIVTYPFNISAPIEMKDELIQILDNQGC